MILVVLLVVVAAVAFGGRPLGRGLRGAALVWRPTSGLLAVLAATGAAVLALKEDWLVAAAMLTLAGGLALGAKRRGAPGTAPADGMSAADARALLGVPEGASRETVETAYRRLIRLNHPDGGGTAGLAAQLNAARAALSARRT